jgi:hypothetical protein
MYIFNRWGEIVFESHDAKVGWKGTFGQTDEIAQDGVYTWKIDYKLKGSDKKRKVAGTVHLLK